MMKPVMMKGGQGKGMSDCGQVRQRQMLMVATPRDPRNGGVWKSEKQRVCGLERGEEGGDGGVLMGKESDFCGKENTAMVLMKKGEEEGERVSCVKEEKKEMTKGEKFGSAASSLVRRFSLKRSLKPKNLLEEKS
eukprot:Sdes_comp18776_c1_seq1m9179